MDWADTHHDVEVSYLAGKRVGVRRFAHSHTGLHELQAFLLGIAASPEELVCIVETTHGLLISFLLEAGIPVYPVNPKTANQLRKAGKEALPVQVTTPEKQREPRLTAETLTNAESALHELDWRLLSWLLRYPLQRADDLVVGVAR